MCRGKKALKCVGLEIHKHQGGCYSYYETSDRFKPPQISYWLEKKYVVLQWRHIWRYGVSKHQPHVFLFNRLLRRRSKKISKLRVTGLCERNSPVPGEFPAQMAINAEHVSMDQQFHPTLYDERNYLSMLVKRGYLGQSYTKHNTAGTVCILPQAVSTTPAVLYQNMQYFTLILHIVYIYFKCH